MSDTFDPRNPAAEIPLRAHSSDYATPRVFNFSPTALPPDWRTPHTMYWRKHWREWFRAREEGVVADQAEILDDVRERLDADLTRLLAVTAILGPTRRGVKVRAALIRVAALPKYTGATMTARRDSAGHVQAVVACPYRFAETFADIQADLAAEGLFDLAAEYDNWLGRVRGLVLGTLHPKDVAGKW